MQWMGPSSTESVRQEAKEKEEKARKDAAKAAQAAKQKEEPKPEAKKGKTDKSAKKLEPEVIETEEPEAEVVDHEACVQSSPPEMVPIWNTMHEKKSANYGNMSFVSCFQQD